MKRPARAPVPRKRRRITHGSALDAAHQYIRTEKESKKILETLQRRGVVEINDSKVDDELFQKMDTASAQTLFGKNRSVAQQAIGVLDEYAPMKKGMLSKLNGREEISLTEYEQESCRAEEIMKVAYRLLALEREIADQKSEILRLETHWKP